MKRLTDDLYQISDGLYAERTAAGWVVSDEDYEQFGGPFATLDELRRDWSAPAPAEAPAAVDAEPIRSDDLVTLSEAAEHIGMTRQGLAAARRRGVLNVSPVVVGRTSVLYSLAALKERYPG